MEQKLISLIRLKFRQLDEKMDSILKEIEAGNSRTVVVDKVMNVKEAAELFDVSENTIRNLIHSGQIPQNKIGRKYLVRYSDVLNAIGLKKNNEVYSSKTN
jgi:excisionase family DNA binding protein